MTTLTLTCPLCGEPLEVPVRVRSVNPHSKWTTVEFHPADVDHVCKTKRK